MFILVQFEKMQSSFTHFYSHFFGAFCMHVHVTCF